MSKIIHVSFKEKLNHQQDAQFKQWLEAVGQAIGPLQTPVHHLITADANTAYTLCVNSQGLIKREGQSTGLGYFRNLQGIGEPLDPAPDGAYALVRISDQYVELLVDALATRTIWYFENSKVCIASSSQRAIVMLLNSFEFNAELTGWMLVNGIVGPSGGWDRRLKRLRVNERLIIDRHAWHVHVKTNEEADDIAEPETTDVQWASEFERLVTEIIGEIRAGVHKSLLPLSGGYDSRLIACHLKDKTNISAITWIYPEKTGEINPERQLAEKVAKHVQLSHEVAVVGLSASMSIEQVYERFVRMSEGLTDNLLAYIDGFDFWERVCREGTQSIIRGDEAFGGAGWMPVKSEIEVRAGLGLSLLSDSPSTAWLTEAGIADPVIPESLKKRPSENLENWRHRLYREYRVPVAIGALTETESAYIDPIKPLQIHSLVNLIKKMPNYLRSDKRILVELAKKKMPNTPYASVREGDQLLGVLSSADSVHFMHEVLTSVQAKSVLPHQLLNSLDKKLHLKKTHSNSGKFNELMRAAQLKLRAQLPRFLKKKLKNLAIVRSIDPYLLAFRATLIVLAEAQFKKDAVYLQDSLNKASWWSDCLHG